MTKECNHKWQIASTWKILDSVMIRRYCKSCLKKEDGEVTVGDVAVWEKSPEYILSNKPKSKDVIEEIVKSVTREDGLLDIGKYDHELLEDLLTKAIQARDEEIIDFIDNKKWAISAEDVLSEGAKGMQTGMLRTFDAIKQHIKQD